jgi:hypothetical protein
MDRSAQRRTEYADYPEILGVYSLRRGDEIGVGATTAKREQ